jgi:hypothetical protein
MQNARTHSPPSLRQTLALVSTLAALTSAVPAQASAIVALTGRTSESNVNYKGGGDIDYTYVGTTTPVTSLLPSTLGLPATSASHSGVRLLYDWSYTVAWELSQSYSIVGDVSGLNQISGQGMTDVSVVSTQACHHILLTCNKDVIGITGLNSQILTFTVSESTAYTITGTIGGGEAVYMQVWNTTDSKWHSFEHFFGSITSFNQSDTLGPGLYRVINSLNSFKADTAPWTQHATWSYTLSFPDAQVTSVPEPASVGLSLAGVLTTLTLARRKRTASS